MRRLHLFEFNDYPWLPLALRRGMTDYLAAAERFGGVAEHMAPLVDRVLVESDADRIVDLGSGGGGPLLDIVPRLSRQVPVLLTDLNPPGEPPPLPPGAAWATESVDATTTDLPGMRTMFEVMHHFEPPLARKILAQAFEQRTPIAVFELTYRQASTLIGTPLIPLMVWLLVPTIRPFRPLTWLFTYLIPVLPVLIWWDGLVSHLRTYRVEELHELVAGLEADDWTWRVEQVQIAPGFVITHLAGIPVQSA